MYTNAMKSRVVMLGDDFFDSSADLWDTMYGNEDEKRGSNATAIATTLIDSLGDIGEAFVAARNNREQAQTPSEADKWDKVLARLEAMEQRPAAIPTGMIIGGGALALGALFLLTRKRR